MSSLWFLSCFAAYPHTKFWFYHPIPVHFIFSYINLFRILHAFANVQFVIMCPGSTLPKAQPIIYDGRLMTLTRCMLVIYSHNRIKILLLLVITIFLQVLYFMLQSKKITNFFQKLRAPLSSLTTNHILFGWYLDCFLFISGVFRIWVDGLFFDKFNFYFNVCCVLVCCLNTKFLSSKFQSLLLSVFRLC